MKWSCLSLFSAACVLSSASAHAQLVHRYDFSDADQGNDTVGTANGTLTGPDNNSIANGMLNLTSGNAGNSLAFNGANGVAVTAGLTGSFSIELYATRTVSGGNFSNFFSFANDGNNFLLFNPDRAGSGSTANFDQAGLHNSTELSISGPNPPAFAANVEQQVVLTYNGTDGTISLYNNGTQFATGSLPGFSLATVNSNGTFAGIGGNTPFTGDPTFQGSFNDFRIYSQALTAAQVATLDNAGPDATNATINADIVPEPSTWVAMLAGVGALLGLQRFRRSVG